MPEPILLLPPRTLSSKFELDAALLDIICDAPMPELDGKPHCKQTARRVANWLQAENSGNTLTAAALWLLAGELEKSHAVSQSDDGSGGSFWHAIMHRREGDFSNSAYWMRRAAKHPAIDDIAKRCPEYANPDDFIDAVESCVTRGVGDKGQLMAIQWCEWQVLFASAY